MVWDRDNKTENIVIIIVNFYKMLCMTSASVKKLVIIMFRQSAEHFIWDICYGLNSAPPLHMLKP